MQEILAQFIPANAHAYCFGLWQHWQFDFEVTKARSSKLGDFRWQLGKREKITVNHNLNQYNFLITYLHELAHLVVYRTYKRRQPAHGKAWKQHFRELLLPMMNENIFPQSVLLPLLDYSKNPKASSSSHLPLMLALRAIDQPNTSLTTVLDVPQGQSFRFNNKTYLRGELRRTRVLCTEQKSQKKFLFVAHSWVEKS
jgi:SprT protein